MLAVLVASVILVAAMIMVESDGGAFLSFGNSGRLSLLGSTVQSKRRRRDSEHGNRYLCEYLEENLEHSAGFQDGPALHYRDIDCGKEYGSSRLGNYLLRWYLTRYIAARANLTLSGSCQYNNVAQWIPQQNLMPNDFVMSSTTLHATNDAAWQEICSICLSNITEVSDKCVFPHGVGMEDPTISVATLVPTIQSDMKGLLHGVLQQTPQLKQEMDDVAIHLRVGDIGSISSGRYGLVPFSVYTKYIDDLVVPHFDSDASFTIGIVTAPFDQNRGRHHPNNPQFNQAVVEAARDFLKDRYPNSTISIRKNAQDTHDVVFARLIGAKRLLFCAPSTFCLVPALGRKPPQHSVMVQSKLFGSSPTSAGWLETVQENSNRTFQYVKESMITSTQLQQMSVDDIIKALSSRENP